MIEFNKGGELEDSQQDFWEQNYFAIKFYYEKKPL